MGGEGSGRWRTSKYTLVEDCGVLEASALRAHFQSRESPPPEGSLVTISSWVAGSDPKQPFALEPVSQAVKFSRTPCPYGGHRLWYVCDCGRRCTKLFVTRKGGQLACRSCHGL